MTTVTSIITSIIDTGYQGPHFVKQLLPKKWKLFMLDLLVDMKRRFTNYEHLISDITTIVSTIPDSSFVQATLEIQPFKPHFQEENLCEAQVTESTLPETNFKVARFKCESSKCFERNTQEEKERITEKTLKQHFNKDFHPYRFILKNFGRLLELKFKKIIEVKKTKVSEVQNLLRDDLKIFREFFKSSSKPYKKLFKIEIHEEETKCEKKLLNFMETYLSEHSKINNSIHKIITYATRNQLTSFFEQKIPDFVKPEVFNIPKDFQIDGCYIRAMNSLMDFSTGSNPEECMSKLGEFRSNILKDIDEFYYNKDGESRELEMSAEIQIEVIRFILGKLKCWCCEIYSQLRFIEVIYGDEDIAYKYEQLSFMYTQLTFAFEIIENE